MAVGVASPVEFGGEGGGRGESDRGGSELLSLEAGIRSPEIIVTHPHVAM